MLMTANAAYPGSAMCLKLKISGSTISSFRLSCPPGGACR